MPCLKNLFTMLSLITDRPEWEATMYPRILSSSSKGSAPITSSRGCCLFRLVDLDSPVVSLMRFSLLLPFSDSSLGREILPAVLITFSEEHANEFRFETSTLYGVFFLMSRVAPHSGMACSRPSFACCNNSCNWASAVDSEDFCWLSVTTA
jgi:hypothetical protein